jgi:transposase-like protein
VASLLKKVEELTLYLIEENKKLKEQNQELEEQNARLTKQQQEIDELKKLIGSKK